MRRLGYDVLLYSLEDSDDRGRFARQTFAVLREHDKPWPTFDHALAYERVFLLDGVQRMFVEPRGDQWVIDRHAFLQLLSLSKDVFSYDPNATDGEDEFMTTSAGYGETLQTLRAHSDKVIRLTRVSSAAGLRQLREIERRVDADVAVGEADTARCLRGLFSTTISRAYEMDLRAIATRRAVWIVMLLHEYHAEHGEFPEKLTDIPSLRDDAEVRQDPFSGQDFAYRRTADGFVLYTWAGDLDDDGGKHDPDWDDGDYLFWPVQHPEKEDAAAP